MLRRLLCKALGHARYLAYYPDVWVCSRCGEVEPAYARIDRTQNPWWRSGKPVVEPLAPERYAELQRGLEREWRNGVSSTKKKPGS